VARIYAGIFGLLAFLTMLIRGLIRDADAINLVLAAWLSMIVFAAVGYAIGWIAGQAVEESVNARIAAQVASNQASGSPEPPGTAT
jgi:hypothetical protein